MIKEFTSGKIKSNQYCLLINYPQYLVISKRRNHYVHGDAGIG